MITTSFFGEPIGEREHTTASIPRDLRWWLSVDLGAEDPVIGYFTSSASKGGTATIRFYSYPDNLVTTVYAPQRYPEIKSIVPAPTEETIAADFQRDFKRDPPWARPVPYLPPEPVKRDRTDWIAWSLLIGIWIGTALLIRWL